MRYTLPLVNDIHDYLKKIGKKGGTNRAQKLTVQQRIDSARKAAEARWAKAEKQLDATMKSLDKTNAVLQRLEKKNKKALLRAQKKRKVKRGT